MKFIDELLEGLFLFWRALELKEHVLHCEIVRHRAAIVRENCFGTRIALERDAIRFIDALDDSRTSMRAGLHLRKDGGGGGESSEDNDDEEP